MITVEKVQTSQIAPTIAIPAGESCVYVEDGVSEPCTDASTAIQVGADATLVYCLTLFVTSEVNRSITIALGKDSKLELYGLVVGSKSGVLNLTIDTTHEAASHGKAFIHCIADDASQLNVKGNIMITKEGNHSNAYFEGRSILRSADAQAKMIPSFEILARDVKASHAAATGPIDPSVLFYLQSRGCTLKEAEALVVEGFAGAIIQRIPDKAAGDAVRMLWAPVLPFDSQT